MNAGSAGRASPAPSGFPGFLMRVASPAAPLEFDGGFEKMSEKHALVPLERIERTILLIRGQKVMLDSDLAQLYEVETKALNKAVKRNIERFPADFMFRLSLKESEALRFHFGTLKLGRGQHRKYTPYVFSEQGVAMLSSVLRSRRAVLVNIDIMRAFVRLREILASHKDLARKLEDLERKCDAQFKVVFEAIRQLIAPPGPEETPKRMGFNVRERSPRYGRKRR
jgi:hypothetical protein